MNPLKPQLIDTFHLPKRAGKKKKQKPASRANNTKKRTPPKDPRPARPPLTPEAKKEKQHAQWKERYNQAKALGLCRHCGEPAIECQTRCIRCAEKHRDHRRKTKDRAARQKDLAPGQTTSRGHLYAGPVEY